MSDPTADKMHNAISTVIRDEAKVMVTKWICLVEVMTEDGTTQMWSIGSPNLSMWDGIGMLEFHNRGLQPEVRNEDD